MSNSLHILIPSIPTKATAQQKGVFIVAGKPRFFKKAAQKSAERNMVALLLAYKPEGFTPLDGPIALSVRLVWPYRKTESKRIVANGIEIPMPVRPDADNLAKMLCDSLMEAGYFAKDDAQITRLTIQKRWGREGYWKIDACPDGETTLWKN